MELDKVFLNAYAASVREASTKKPKAYSQSTVKSKIVQGSTICNFDSPYGYAVRSAVK